MFAKVKVNDPISALCIHKNMLAALIPEKGNDWFSSIILFNCLFYTGLVLFSLTKFPPLVSILRSEFDKM